MQFGKYFLSQQESAWVPHYLNYSRLKKMLKCARTLAIRGVDTADNQSYEVS